MRHIRSFAVAFVCLSLVTAAPRADAPPQAATATSTVPSDAEIRRLLVERVDTHRQSVGIVVGVIGPEGRRIVSYGRRAVGDTAPLDGDTVFEIGSVTKVFTSLLLADAVRRGEVALTDPVAKYLPAKVTVPTRGDRAITLLDLATHTSALPRLPTNFAPKDAANPYADYSVEQLYAFLSSVSAHARHRRAYEYSNLGVGLLGHALARRAGHGLRDAGAHAHHRTARHEEHRDRVDAGSARRASRLAITVSSNPTANWDFPTLRRRRRAARLGQRSAHVPRRGHRRHDARRSHRRSRRRWPSGGQPASRPHEIALGWHISTGTTTELVWHNGGTGGYRSWIGFEPRTRTGVVVLMNAGDAGGRR